MENISSATRTVLNYVAADFQLSNSQLVDVTKQIVQDFNDGLKEVGHPVTMAPSFVTRVPDGNEKGTFLTLGLCWRTLRVSEVTLCGANVFTQRHKIFQMPDDVCSGQVIDFFDYMATSVDSFLKEYRIQTTAEMPAHIGFVFPFPVEKMGLGRAKLLSWTKGFKIQGGPGQNVDQLLQDAFTRKNVNVTCAAVVNDTVATLLSGSYTLPADKCSISAIFGVGTNGTYVEDTTNITKLGKSSGGKMLVNTEWGGFNNNSVLPITAYDRTLDRQSVRPGFHVFEKLISWFYIGELTRLLILSLVERSSPILFNGFATSKLKAIQSFDARSMSLIEEASSLNDIKQVLVNCFDYSVDSVSDEDAEIVRWATQLVANRAINLSACAIGAILAQTGYTQVGTGRVSIAVAGEMVLFYPQFENRLRLALKTIVGEGLEKRVDFLPVTDGDAIGAALTLYEMEANK